MSEQRHLLVGGLVAVGFDASGQFLLTISHSGRGVFSVGTWGLVARDYALTYPVNRHGIGIGPIDGEVIAVNELDGEHDISILSPDGQFSLECRSDGITVAKPTP